MAIKLLPTLLEVLALFYFAEHSLTAKVSKMKRYIANICFYLLDCGATALRQNLQMINANIDSWKEAYMEQRRYTHDFQNKLLVLRGLAGKEGTDGAAVYRALRERGVLVRHWNKPKISGYCRITVGTPEQNDALLRAIDEFLR